MARKREFRVRDPCIESTRSLPRATRLTPRFLASAYPTSTNSKRAPAKQRHQPVLHRVRAGHQQLRRERHHQAVHVHELTRDGGRHRLPSSLPHPPRDLLRALALGALSAVADQHESRLQDVEIAALEVSGGGVAPDRDAVVPGRSGWRSRSRRGRLLICMWQMSAPQGVMAPRVAGEEVAMQDLVGVQVVAGRRRSTRRSRPSRRAATWRSGG